MGGCRQGRHSRLRVVLRSGGWACLHICRSAIKVWMVPTRFTDMAAMTECISATANHAFKHAYCVTTA